MTIYGSSIEGRPLQVQSIIAENSKSKKQEKMPKISKKAQAIIEQNKKKKLDEIENQEKTMLQNFEVEYKKNKKDHYSYLSTLNICLNKFISPKILLETEIYKVKILVQILKETQNNQKKQNGFKKELFLTIRKILTKYSSVSLTNSQNEILSVALEKIDCLEIARYNNLPLKHYESDKYNENWLQYQLEQLGPELERLSDGTPDPRVNGFIPDSWQRKLFDIVDNRQSAIIIAPTSSGKTYASYYCMESILREGREGIVVYVSPTKALVNQVAATVYARFKNTSMENGQSVYGIFTRDYRTHATNSQILVTVPQCLELLLLSPRKYGWVKRLKYVIFDEVHCIAGNIGGLSWERCLLLIRCPFLALSATIERPDQLHNWLCKAEEFKRNQNILLGDKRPDSSYKVHLVIHSERHSDLTNYIYQNGNLDHLHPYANLNNNVLKSHQGIPKHIFLSPSETLELYEAMKTTDSQTIVEKKLDPLRCITRLVNQKENISSLEYFQKGNFLFVICVKYYFK